MEKVEQSTKKYKATKLPMEVFDEAELAKARIIMNRKALERLPPEVINPSRCPICGNKMKAVETNIKVGFVSCEECGYKQPYLNVKAVSNDPAALATALGLGVLAGLGIAALLYLIFGGEKK